MDAISPTPAAPAQCSISEIAEFVLRAAPGSVIAVGGISSEQMRLLLDDSVSGDEPRLALFIPLTLAISAEQIVEQVLDLLAETALRMWPNWFTDVDFGGFRNDTLGREAARVKVRHVSNNTPAVLRPWAEAAVMLALDNRRPRIPGIIAATELEQLCLAINRAGLVMIVDTAALQSQAAALVHALEWMSRHARAAVVALFMELPRNIPPFDRVLHGAVTVVDARLEAGFSLSKEPAAIDRPWLAPVRGKPHPLSETEQRLAKALAGDSELAPLFGFNQFVETVRGGHPKVDLLWTAGRLVVELDGFADHGSRAVFVRDRHRDYELMLSGFTVLRLANDEIAQDIEKAVEKIRDIVQLCRSRMV